MDEHLGTVCVNDYDQVSTAAPSSLFSWMKVVKRCGSARSIHRCSRILVLRSWRWWTCIGGTVKSVTACNLCSFYGRIYIFFKCDHGRTRVFTKQYNGIPDTRDPWDISYSLQQDDIYSIQKTEPVHVIWQLIRVKNVYRPSTASNQCRWLLLQNIFFLNVTRYKKVNSLALHKLWCEIKSCNLIENMFIFHTIVGLF